MKTVLLLVLNIIRCRLRKVEMSYVSDDYRIFRYFVNIKLTYIHLMHFKGTVARDFCYSLIKLFSSFLYFRSRFFDSSLSSIYSSIYGAQISRLRGFLFFFHVREVIRIFR
jgi:hypothetical protein